MTELPKHLMIGDAEQRAIDAVIQRAQTNTQRWDDTARKNAMLSPPPEFLSLADRKRLGIGVIKQSLTNVVVIPDGFTCCFRYEETPYGIQRHLSVSIEASGKTPGPEIMGAIATAFHFTRTDAVWAEEFEPGQNAVHVVELIPNAKLTT